MRITIQKQTNKILTALVGAALLSVAIPGEVHAQTPPTNVISGFVWQDLGTSNGIREAGEPRIPGIVVHLIAIAGSQAVVDATVTDTNGYFELKNYKGTDSTLRVVYFFPEAGYTVGPRRNGSVNDSLNSSAQKNGDNQAFSTDILAENLDAKFDLPNYGMALVRKSKTRTFYVVKEATATDWNKTVRFPKWSGPLLGDDPNAQLESASLFIANFGKHPHVGAENESTPASITLNAGNILTVKLEDVPSNGGNDLYLTYESKTDGLTRLYAAYDSVTDFAGASGYTYYNKSGANRQFTVAGSGATSNTKVFESDDFGLLVGGVGDSVTLEAASQGSVKAAGGGNTKTTVATTAGAGFFLTYIADEPLPLKLVSFTAQESDNSSLLRWEAVSDGTPGEYFAVEFSTDGVNFKTIGKVDAITDKKSVQKYQYRHLNPVTGKNYYRLRMIEHEADANISQVALLNFKDAAEQTVRVFPMPADATMNIDGSMAGAEAVRLTNLMGQQMTLPVTKNGDRIQLNTQNLPNGVYFLQIDQADGSAYTQKVMVQHK